MAAGSSSFVRRVARRLQQVPGRSRWHLREVASLTLSLPVVSADARARLLGVLLGHGVRGHVSPLVRLLGEGRLTVGEGAFINTGCLLDVSGELTLERNVHLAPRVSIYTSTHALGGPERRAGEVLRTHVRIGEGCWIGANTVILPGVSIAPGIVVGAGAVVTKSLTEPGVYGGVPARWLRKLEG